MNKNGFGTIGKPVKTVNELRKTWESEQEWTSRKKFLERHWDSTMEPFELDSLSSVWLNSLVLGCSYPEKTTKRVKELAEGLEVDGLIHLPGELKEFVKRFEHNDDEAGQNSGSSNTTTRDTPLISESTFVNPLKKRRRLHDFESPGIDQEEIEVEQSCPRKRETKNLITTSAEERRPEENNNESLYTNNLSAVFKETRLLGDFDEPVNGSLSLPPPATNIDMERATSPIPEIVPVKKEFVESRELYVLEPSSELNLRAITRRNENVTSNLTDILVSKLESSNTRVISLDSLTNQSEHMQSKSNQNQTSMTSSINKLDCTNIGHKLLEKMSWSSGTGLGKERQGRVDPVEAVVNFSRRGLGCGILTKKMQMEAKKARIKAKKSEIKAKKALLKSSKIAKGKLKRKKKKPVHKSSQFGSSDEEEAVIYNSRTLSDEEPPISSRLRSRTKLAVKLKESNANLIEKFVILCNEGETLSNVSFAKRILHRSFKLNNLTYEYINTKLSNGSAQSGLHVGGQFLCQGFAVNGRSKAGNALMKNAEADAALKALEVIRKNNPVIRVVQIKNQATDYDPESLDGYNKQMIEIETSVKLTKEEKREKRRERKEKKQHQNSLRKLDSDNVGHKLLEKMGWSSGTGLGKEEQGRVDPVEAIGNHSRGGLGTGIFTKNLSEKPDTSLKTIKIKKAVGLSEELAANIITAYVESGSEDPLTFSSGFTSEDRKILHTVSQKVAKAHKVELDTQSYGNENRYLSISRLLTSDRLYQLANYPGQRFGRYEVVSVSHTDKSNQA